MKKILMFLILILATSSLFSQDIVGSWNGTLNVGTAKLRLVINIDGDGNDGYTATMDSPDQGAKGIPVSKVTLDDNKLSLEVQALQMSYNGEIQENVIDGTFVQRGQSFPLVLKKGDIEVNRPQEPKPPFLYHSEDVTFYNGEADIKLAGTFTYPTIGNKLAAVVLITGSGAQNRDEELFGHKPFLVLSNYLTNNGIAVLRFDDRGVGESEGDFSSATSKDLGTDVMAAVNFLKKREEINSSKIGLIGHSEGGLIAFALASEYPKEIAFLVSMAGAAIRGDSLLMQQRYDIGKAMGATNAQIEENENLVIKIEKIVSQYTLEEIEAKKEILIDELVPIVHAENMEVKKAMFQELKRAASPWIRYTLKYDVGEKMDNIICPVFAINGSKDLQVNAEQNINRIKERIGNKNGLKTKIYSNLNHLFQTSSTGLPQEYGIIEETIAPEVLKDITDWIKGVTK